MHTHELRMVTAQPNLVYRAGVSTGRTQDNGLVDAGLWSGEEVRPVRVAAASRLSSVASLQYCLRVCFAG
jgi:hypothetical protein